MAWTSLTFPFGSTLTSAKMTQLYDNFQAFANKASGAPTLANGYVVNAMLGTNSISQAKMQDNSVGAPELQANCVGSSELATDAVTATHIAAGAVGQSEVGANAIGQSELKDNTGSVSTSVTASYADLTLPGGAYGFYPQVYEDGIGGVDAKISDDYGVASWSTNIALKSQSGSLVQARHRYFTASAPYDLGDGEVHHFIFAVVDTNGNILASYEAPEAPWHYNGPTRISADFFDKQGRGYQLKKDISGIPPGLPLSERAAAIKAAPVVPVEVTQDVKQADMGLIPHPFNLSQFPAGSTVVMLDPVSEQTSRIKLLSEIGELDILQSLSKKVVKISNNPVNRATPNGVIAVPFTF